MSHRIFSESIHLTLLSDPEPKDLLRKKSRAETLSSVPKIRYAVCLMIISAITYSFMGVIVKWSETLGYDSMEPLVFRSGIQVLLSLIFSLIEKNKENGKYRCLISVCVDNMKKMEYKLYVYVILRGIVSGGGLACYFISLEYINLGDAIAILSMYPVFTSFAAYFVLKESLTKLHGMVTMRICCFFFCFCFFFI